MAELKRAGVVARGKTKTIHGVKGKPNLIIAENRDDITKNDDPSQTRQMAGKARHATATTCAVFELLKKAGLPVAYERRLSETEFAARRCVMIPLEVVVRRYAAGSFLKRFPNLTLGDGRYLHRFSRLEFELFLKTTGGVVRSRHGEEIGRMPSAADGRPIDDPLIIEHESVQWRLGHPKVPSWMEGSDLGVSVSLYDILQDNLALDAVEMIARKTGLLLEGAWAQFGFRLLDLKIEFGVARDGTVMIADVIDNDSWRLRTGDGRELSKQLFRDGRGMEEVAEGYAAVARFVEGFRVPRQALVIWSGSPRDQAVEATAPAGVHVVHGCVSGHKSPRRCLELLDRLRTEFPEGGVILVSVGMSNGLGPMLAARSGWPVIAVPSGAGERPHDVWSSLEMPSEVPLMTVLSRSNAVLAALSILALKNPVAYMQRQYAIEELDD